MIDTTGIGRASGRDILIRGTAVHGTNGELMEQWEGTGKPRGGGDKRGSRG